MNKRLKRIFHNMKSRCYNSNVPCYKHYGGKGITICDEWLKEPLSFERWALKNGYSDDLTIDRIDGSKGYNPKNCRWVSWKKQQNNRMNNHFITYKGQRKTLAQWCEELGLNYHSVKHRINTYNVPINVALGNKSNLHIKLITYKGKTMCIKDWSRELGINYVTLHHRICKAKWSIEKAFEKKQEC